MNAITLLKQDHRNVEAFFERYAHSANDETRCDAVEKLIEHLSVHAAIEEEVFYAAVSAAVPDLASNILSSREERHVMKWLLYELTKLPSAPTSMDRACAKMHVLRLTVEHHVNDEEAVVFPRVLEAIPLERLNEIGETLELAKQHAPTRPHPRVPDEPPLNIIIDTALSLVDRAVHTGRHAVTRVMRSSH